jgi:hypothetical protein
MDRLAGQPLRGAHLTPFDRQPRRPGQHQIAADGNRRPLLEHRGEPTVDALTQRRWHQVSIDARRYRAPIRQPGQLFRPPDFGAARTTQPTGPSGPLGTAPLTDGSAEESAHLTAGCALPEDAEREFGLLFDDEVHEIVWHTGVAGCHPNRDVATDIAGTTADQPDPVLPVIEPPKDNIHRDHANTAGGTVATEFRLALQRWASAC